MINLSKSISKAIKESRWLAIDYQNINNETTSYWLAIQDVYIEDKRFKADIFNASKINNNSHGFLESITIIFDRILKAKVLEHTTYKQNTNLIPKIEANIECLNWLSFDLYSNNTINYIYDAMKHESVAFQQETALVSGIDDDTLVNIETENLYELSLMQAAELTKEIELLSLMDKTKRYRVTTLALNLLSIKTNRGLFVVAYKELLFDPSRRSLILSNDIKFNYDFASKENDTYKHNLRNYLDVEVEEFTSLFLENRKKAKEMLQEVLPRFKETIDSRPYIMDLVRTHNEYIYKELDQLKMKSKENILTTPLKAFFGNMNKRLLSRKRSVHVVVLDDILNIDQLRLIYNALTQPITYVQGPPGTGKTQSIINLLISAFFNNDKVLVSSNNNKPIDDIYEKVMSIKGNYGKIPLPFLRIGNNDKTLESLKHIKNNLDFFKRYDVIDNRLNSHELSNKERVKQINDLISTYEEQVELIEEIDALESFAKSIANNMQASIKIQAEIENKKKILNNSTRIHESHVKEVITKADNNFLSWLFFTSIKHYKRIFEPKNESLLKIINSEDDFEMIRDFNLYLKDDENLKNLQRIFPIILTTNQSAHKLGTQQTHFDLAIIDEAGQCSIGPSLFVIARAERLLLVGDQNQLRPVVSLSKETDRVLLDKYEVSENYSYTKNSILTTMQKLDTISKFILLSYHYRSHEDIINFSNRKYYNNKLVLPNKGTYKNKALHYIDIDSGSIGRSNERNTSILEAQAIVDHIKKYKLKSVGIITPFRTQANLLRNILKEEKLDNVTSGTIHTFQGDEKDNIFLSLGITQYSGDGTFDWLKNNEELINVATTRAKKRLLLVGDLKEVKRRSLIDNDIKELVTYVKQNGKHVKLTRNDSNNYVNGANYKQYNTKTEREFFKTINHLLSLNNKYVVKHNVRVASILDNYTKPILHDYGMKAEFDLVIFSKQGKSLIPVLIIEIDGDEHQYNQKTINRDKLKEEICRDNNINLLRIKNDYSRRYILIKDTLIDLLD